MSPRRDTELAQVRALLDVWRMRGCDDAWSYILGAEKMLAAERVWYERLGIPERYGPQKRPLRVRFAMWLLGRDRRHQWWPRLKAFAQRVAS